MTTGLSVFLFFKHIDQSFSYMSHVATYYIVKEVDNQLVLIKIYCICTRHRNIESCSTCKLPGLIFSFTYLAHCIDVCVVLSLLI